MSRIEFISYSKLPHLLKLYVFLQLPLTDVSLCLSLVLVYELPISSACLDREPMLSPTEP